MWRNCITWFTGIETDMFKAIIVLDMVTASIILGKWLRPGLKRKWGILWGEIFFLWSYSYIALRTQQPVATVFESIVQSVNFLSFVFFFSVKLWIGNAFVLIFEFILSLLHLVQSKSSWNPIPGTVAPEASCTGDGIHR